MAINKEQVRDLLGCNLSPSVVAATVGCDPSYITQLLSDEAFAGEVVALKTRALTAANERDSKLDGVEESLLEQLKEQVEMSMYYKPADLLRAYSVVNAAKRRGVAAHEGITINNNIVMLMVPEKVVQTFTTNSQGEVVEVEGQTLVTMPAHTLLKELQAKRGNNGAYEKVARYLPASITAREQERDSEREPIDA